MLHVTRPMIAVILGSMCASADADVLNVPSKTYPTIQSAIDAAVDSDEVLVAPGVYNESIDYLGKAITVRGSGGADVTTIQGQGGAVVAGVFDFDSGEEDVYLEGFTITVGTGARVGEITSGGGVYAHGDTARLHITDCVFLSNFADIGGGVWTNADAWLTDCTFIGNSALTSAGGAVYGRCTLLRCSFQSNSSAGSGGAARLRSGSTITDCEFVQNVAQFNGGAVSVSGDWAYLTVEGSTFVGNVSGANGPRSGGAIQVSARYDATLHASDSEFIGNMSDNGGGVSVSGGNGCTRLVGCRFVDNIASDRGGAVKLFAGGDAGPIEIIDRCEFINNEASKGGAMHLGASFTPGPKPIVNSVFFQNSASSRGGAIFSDGSDLSLFSRFFLVNCTLVQNAAPEGAAIYHDGTDGALIAVYNSILWGNGGAEDIFANGGGAEAAHSDIERAFPGEGNISLPPLFADEAEGNFRLLPGSPCIDSGNNDLATHAMPTDFLGEARLYDDPGAEDCAFAKYCGEAPIVDMGAFERRIVTGDLDGDGTVDAADLAILLGNWGPCPDCPTDLNGDGVVGPADLAIVLGNWG